MATTPRFVWMDPYDGARYWVIDLQAPGAEPGQAVRFGDFDTKQAAVMTALALNGG